MLLRAQAGHDLDSVALQDALVSCPGQMRRILYAAGMAANPSSTNGRKPRTSHMFGPGQPRLQRVPFILAGASILAGALLNREVE
jgi:hypothetical protein